MTGETTGFDAFAAADSLHDSATLLAHPGFDTAYRRMLASLAQLWSSHPKLVRALFDYDHTIVFMVALCIDAASEPDDAHSWLTLPNLIEKVALMGVTGERHIRRILDGYRDRGMLESAPLDRDRRQLRFRPTSQMLEVDREWLATFHAPLAELYPDEPRYRAALALDADYQAAYRRAGLTTLTLAHEIIERNEVAEFFLHRTVGIRLMALMIADADSSPDHALPDGFFTTAAQRSGTSRVHVRNVVNAAAAQGFVQVQRGFRYLLTPTLYEGARRWVAASLVGTDVVCALATREGAR